MASRAFDQVFSRLCEILRNRRGNLTIEDQSPRPFCLVGGKHPRHKTPMPVAWTEVAKNYVSFHLMPVYGHPKRLETISPGLRARMQGKSCFNFKELDEALIKELDQLTAAGFAAFKKAGFME